MLILFDQGTPVPLRDVLASHTVATTFERSWHQLTNGQLLDAAEAAGFELLLTTDQHLRDQQNLAKRTIRILVLKTASWPKIERHSGLVADAIDGMQAGEYRELSFPSG